MPGQNPVTSFKRGDRTVVAVADLHGHLSLFERLLKKLDAELGQDYVLVTLGDYVDNGPEIKELLDALIWLKNERPDRFFPIIGDHDLACLRTLGWPGDKPDQKWYDLWHTLWNSALETPRRYGATNAAAFSQNFHPAHFNFLAELPWFMECEDYYFVHAGLKQGAVEIQSRELRLRRIPPGQTFLDQIADSRLSLLCDHDFKGTVVSAHTRAYKMKARGAELTPENCFVAPGRITLQADIDSDGPLAYVLLPRLEVRLLEHS